VSTDETAGATTIAVVGEIDVLRQTELPNLVAILDPEPGTTIHVDLSEVTFIDSSGIVSILQAQKYLEARQCALRLIDPHGHVRRLMELTGLSGVVTFVD
jgi:anti-anti-sigma factor